MNEEMKKEGKTKARLLVKQRGEGEGMKGEKRGEKREEDEERDEEMGRGRERERGGRE